MARGAYVYAIVYRDTTVPAGLRGLNEVPLETITCRELAAVTSALDFGGLRPSVDNVLRHEAVVEAVREVGTALPVRFGTILAGSDAVVRELNARYDALAADLAQLGGKSEYGLVVLWQPADGEDAETEALAAAAPGDGALYLQTRRAEYRRESRQRERAQALAGELHALLGEHAESRRTTVLPTQRLALRAAYLVAPERAEHFCSAFDHARRLHPEHRLLLSGPWPPYSFISTPAVEAEPAAACMPADDRRESWPLR